MSDNDKDVRIAQLEDELAQARVCGSCKHLYIDYDSDLICSKCNNMMYLSSKCSEWEQREVSDDVL